jgi:hypothetical protein
MSVLTCIYYCDPAALSIEDGLGASPCKSPRYGSASVLCSACPVLGDLCSACSVCFAVHALLGDANAILHVNQLAHTSCKHMLGVRQQLVVEA